MVHSLAICASVVDWLTASAPKDSSAGATLIRVTRFEMQTSPEGAPSPRRGGTYRWVAGLVWCYAAALLVYSQTRAYTWDEGYHLLAAQLIAAGKRPYIDFCFPQTPLNAYWNAAWMRLLGESWRVPQALAAVLTSGAVFLMADYVFVRFPVPRWRAAAAAAAVLA